MVEINNVLNLIKMTNKEFEYYSNRIIVSNV